MNARPQRDHAPRASGQPRGARPTKAGAFTLLEVLLAMGLTAVLLLAISSAISLHLRAFHTGRTDVEQAQLARALLNRLGEDLRSLAPPSAWTIDQVLEPAPPSTLVPPAAGGASAPQGAAPGSPAATAPLSPAPSGPTAPSQPPSATTPSAGGTGAPTSQLAPPPPVESLPTEPPGGRPLLRGSARRLTLLVRRPPRPQPLDPALATDPQARALWAGLLKVDFELFGAEDEPALLNDSAGAFQPAGLVRSVRVWAPGEEQEPPGELGQPSFLGTETEPRAMGATPGEETSPRWDRLGETSGDEPSQTPPADLNLLQIPEVVDWQLRYFDGQTWTTGWVGRPENPLPVAIEVSLALAPADQAVELRREGPWFQEPDEFAEAAPPGGPGPRGPAPDGYPPPTEAASAAAGSIPVRRDLVFYRQVFVLPLGRPVAAEPAGGFDTQFEPAPTPASALPGTPLPTSPGARP